MILKCKCGHTLEVEGDNLSDFFCEEDQAYCFLPICSNDKCDLYEIEQYTIL